MDKIKGSSPLVYRRIINSYLPWWEGVRGRGNLSDFTPTLPLPSGKGIPQERLKIKDVEKTLEDTEELIKLLDKEAK